MTTMDLKPNYDKKTLHVALAFQGRKNIDRGIVYLPKAVYSKMNIFSERMYEDFFKRGGEFGLVPVVTHQSAGELAKTLEEKFGVEKGIWVGGIIAPFKATLEQARDIIKDLRENPQDYYNSPEKAIFGGEAFIV
ncbi:MAG: hypothetical protein IIA87_03935 [Nanoarchaeota archaeon]|nr:hypothetical protein [Nanoarchaeota archaeon]